MCIYFLLNILKCDLKRAIFLIKRQKITSGIKQVKSKNFGKRNSPLDISVKFRVEQVVLNIL